MSAPRNESFFRSALLAGWALGTLVLLFSLILLGYELYRRGSSGAGPAPEAPRFAAARATDEAANEEEVLLYFGSPSALGLVAEPRLIELSTDSVENCKRAFAELLAGPRSDAVAILPEDVSIRAMYLLDSGELAVDLSRGVNAPEVSSVSAETLLIRGMVATLAQRRLQTPSGPTIRSVRLLVEGAPAGSQFPKHVRLEGPIEPDASWTTVARSPASNG